MYNRAVCGTGGTQDERKQEEERNRLLRLCVCSFDLGAVRREKRAGMIEMIDSSALQCVGVIPFDKTLQRAQDRGSLPDRRSLTAAACRNIARRIMGYGVPLFDGMPGLARKTRLAL